MLQVRKEQTLTADGLHFCDVYPDHGEPLLRLFNRTFVVEHSTGCPRTPEHWRWKYDDNPGGNWSRVVLDGNARVLGHKGSLPFMLDGDGPGAMAVQSLDHMVERRGAWGLRGASLFGRLSRDWAEFYGSDPRCSFAYGLPSPADFKSGERNGLYALLHDVKVLYGQSQATRSSASEVIITRLATRVPYDADELWKACRPIGCLALRRDSAYLTWRYQKCPAPNYGVIEARERSTGALVGLCIFRVGGPAPDVLCLMEWIVAEGDEEAAHALLHACRMEQARHGLGGIVVWQSPTSLWHRWFRESGFSERETGYKLVGWPFTKRLEVADLRHRFHVSFGDFDYY